MLNSRKKEESIVGRVFSLIACSTFLLILFATAVLGLIIYLALAGGGLVLVSWLGWLAAKKGQASETREERHVHAERHDDAVLPLVCSG